MWGIIVWIVTFVILIIFHIIKEPLFSFTSKFYKQYYRGLKLFKEKKYTEALRYMEEAKRINQRKSIVYSGEACIYMLKGENKKAIESFEYSLELSKRKKQEIKALLSFLYMEEKSKDIDSLSLIKEAINEIKSKKHIKWEYTKSFFYDIYSWINYKLGNIEKCDKYFAKSKKELGKLYDAIYRIEVEAYIPIMFYHFGIILKHKGEYKKAIEYFKKSIKAGGPESIFTKRSEEEIRKIVNGEL